MISYTQILDLIDQRVRDLEIKLDKASSCPDRTAIRHQTSALSSFKDELVQKAAEEVQRINNQYRSHDPGCDGGITWGEECNCHLSGD